jgi:hypothetical protein
MYGYEAGTYITVILTPTVCIYRWDKYRGKQPPGIKKLYVWQARLAMEHRFTSTHIPINLPQVSRWL